ncbi:conserved protein of unknown function [Georgfuchsia toluolica]|uniref:Uncharacterized protein n=1 Tax=Georgfuchsia toluolica TaxID=424218 RepID=A0A916J191_9PROT|nr:hypothetical protein [Georgfuchsia toluolica]CAG4882265.1 conserved protein of unknown function [Georgfuchsia toluolica]
MTPERIKAAEKFGAALHDLTNEVEMWQTNKNRAAAASFGIALDHHAAIVFLMKNTFYSSSFALLRILFETYLRGLWLKHCATDAQVSGFFRGDEPPKTMIVEIESTEAFKSGVLSRIKKANWNAMCDFTHTGGLHLQRWQSQDAVEPTFEPDELEECLNCAELFGVMAGLELVQLSKSGSDGADVLQLMKSRWP